MTRGFDPRRRLLVPERMDEETVDAAELGACLDDLERLSALTLGHCPTLSWLARQARALPPGTEATLLDVGCGDGGMLRRIWHWTARRGLRLDLHGIDLNPVALAVARARTPAGAPIAYAQGDALAPSSGPRPDFVVCALFLHHLDDAQAVQFLRWIEGRAARGWLVSDLHRHALSYWFLRVVPPLLRMHRFVRHDGPVSVARGWTRAELLALLSRAGVAAHVRWRLPFRWTVEGGPA